MPGTIERRALKKAATLLDTDFLLFVSSNGGTNSGNKLITWANVKEELDSELSTFDVEVTFAAGVDMNGTELVLDADGDTSITADTDDQIDIRVSGADDFTFTANSFNILSGSSLVVQTGGLLDVNGIADGLVLDADGDTTISAPTDDQIDIEISGADDFSFTANSFNVLSGSDIDLADSASIKFGDADDFELRWDGTWMEAVTTGAQAIWSGAPSPADPSYQSIAHEFWEDWLEEDDDWTTTADSTGTTAIGDSNFGVMVVSCAAAAADDDATQIQYAQETFQMISGKEIWFEARVRVTDTSDECDFFIGLAEAEDITGVADNMPANGFGFKKDDGDSNIDLSTSDGGSDVTSDALHTLVINTWVRLGFHFDGGATGSGTITPYIDGVAGTAITTAAYATMAEVSPLFMIRNGAADVSQTLEIDYVKVVQIR